MTKTILVTGSSGFIGFHVSKALLKQGYQVVGIDDHNDSTSVPLKERRQSALDQEENFSFTLGSINNRELLEALFQKNSFFGVINLAARAGVRKSIEDPKAYVMTNELGLIELLSLCQEHKVERFIQASTSSIYEGENLPFLESMPGNTPISPYAASKKGAEGYAYVYHHLCGIPTTILRFFTVYGPYGRPDMSIFRFCKWIYEQKSIQIYGDGSQTRDFTYVEDVARAVLLCLDKAEGFQIYNVGNDHTHSLLEMIKILEKYLGRSANLAFHPKDPLDMQHTRANIDKLRKMGWAPKVSFEEGLKETAQWFSQEYDWVKHIEI